MCIRIYVYDNYISVCTLISYNDASVKCVYEYICNFMHISYKLSKHAQSTFD